MTQAQLIDAVPDAALESDICAVAQKGAGKTYRMRLLVERLLTAGRRVIIMDPLNSWWGLKAMADGTPGFPIVVIGGPNADIELDPLAGEQLGEYLAGAAISCVIDVSELKRGEMIRFATAFLAALYHRNRDALWLVLEEADVFAPQSPMGDATVLLHTVDQIARRGRARGFRLWSITQRPAKIAKDVLTQVSTMILLRIRSPQDRAAVEDWVRGNATAAQTREVIGSLASLKTGEGWVYSPDFDLLSRSMFPRIATLDTSFTPTAGEARVVVKELARADVEGIRKAMGASAVKEPAKIGQGMLDDAFNRGRSAGTQAGFAEGVARTKAAIVEDFRRFVDSLRIERGVDDGAELVAPHAGAEAQRLLAKSEPLLEVAEALGRSARSGVVEAITKQQSHLLGALVAAYNVFGKPIDKNLLAWFADVSHKSSSFGNNLGALRTAGLIDYPQPGVIKPTEAGAASAPMVPIPKTNDEVQRAVLNKLPAAQQRILEVLLEDHPRDVGRNDVAERVGASPTSSSFGNNLGALRSLGFIDYPSTGRSKASDMLFPYGAGRR